MPFSSANCDVQSKGHDSQAPASDDCAWARSHRPLQFSVLINVAVQTAARRDPGDHVGQFREQAKMSQHAPDYPGWIHFLLSAHLHLLYSTRCYTHSDTRMPSFRD